MAAFTSDISYKPYTMYFLSKMHLEVCMEFDEFCFINRMCEILQRTSDNNYLQ
jgi:hypothetical protein